MINQAADPPPPPPPPLGGRGAGEGCGGSGAERVAFAEGKSPAVGGGRLGVRSLPAAGAGRSRAGAERARPGSAGEGRSRGRAARPHRAGAGGARSAVFWPRCGGGAPPARARTMGAPLAVALGASTTWHFSCNSAAPAAGHAPWDNHISGHGEVGSPPPRTSPPNPTLGSVAPTWPSPDSSPRRRWRESEGRPLRVCGPALAYWPFLRTRCTPGGTPMPLQRRLLSHTTTLAFGYIHLHDQPRTHSSTFAAFSHNSYPHTSPDTSDRPHFCAHLDTQQARPEGSHPCQLAPPEHSSLPARLPADTVAKYTHL